jgi:hypothetical protein
MNSEVKIDIEGKKFFTMVEGYEAYIDLSI